MVKEVPVKDNITDIVEGATCFSEHARLDVKCANTVCKYWIDCAQHNNCTMIGADKGTMTLQQIGNIFGVTRMRICQIEKSILKKLIAKTNSVSDS